MIFICSPRIGARHGPDQQDDGAVGPVARSDFDDVTVKAVENLRAPPAPCNQEPYLNQRSEAKDASSPVTEQDGQVGRAHVAVAVKIGVPLS